MNTQEEIETYIAGQAEPKRSDMQRLHRIILQVMPACKLWFLDGKNSEDKTVSNPNIGYGLHTITYADGKIREFYQIGMSANKTVPPHLIVASRTPLGDECLHLFGVPAASFWWGPRWRRHSEG